jgi:hypothetical protein
MVRLTSLLIATALIGSGQSYGDLFSVIRLIRRPSAYSANPEMISAYRNTRVPVDVIGLRSITGVQQSWLLEAHGSFANVEATDAALAAVGGSGQSTEPDFATLIGVLRPGLSYRPTDAIKSLPLARFFQVTIFRTRPGHSYEFAELIRMRNAAQDYINLDRPEIGYQIVSGTEAGTYFFLAPMQSLAAIDNAIATTWGRSDAAGHGARQASNNVASEAEVYREQLLFRVEPQMSSVSETFAGSAQDFWLGK